MLSEKKHTNYYIPLQRQQQLFVHDLHLKRRSSSRAGTCCEVEETRNPALVRTLLSKEIIQCVCTKKWIFIFKI